MLLLCLLGLSLTSGLGLGDEPDNVVVPVKYTTTREHIFATANGNQVFWASIDCKNLIDANIEVCAELPRNWERKRDHGFTFLNIYNDESQTDNLTAALYSTGKPVKGAPVPAECINITKWPGGDIYIRVDSNNYAPVRYTVSALVMPPTTPATQTETDKAAIAPSVGYGLKARDDMVKLTPVAILEDMAQLQYDHAKLLRIETCFDKTTTNVILTTALISLDGTLIHYVCDGLPCNPDALTVVCSQPIALPVTFCTAQFKAGQKTVYIYIHAAGGALNSKNIYESTFKFTGSFN